MSAKNVSLRNVVDTKLHLNLFSNYVILSLLSTVDAKLAGPIFLELGAATNITQRGRNGRMQEEFVSRATLQVRAS